MTGAEMSLVSWVIQALSKNESEVEGISDVPGPGRKRGKMLRVVGHLPWYGIGTGLGLAGVGQASVGETAGVFRRDGLAGLIYGDLTFAQFWTAAFGNDGWR